MSACFIPNLMGLTPMTRGIRQVMSPSSNTLPDTVPTLPLLDARPIHDRSISQLAFTVLGLFTILHWLTANHWSQDTETVNDLYWHTCRHTSFSLTHLAQFTASFFLLLLATVSILQQHALMLSPLQSPWRR